MNYASENGVIINGTFELGNDESFSAGCDGRSDLKE